jgi:hypothetical protein
MIRGNFDQTFPIGCIRVFMTLSCSSLVMWLRRCAVALSAASEFCVVCWSTWLRASTSSPTSVIRLSRRPTSTRIDASATAPDDSF